MDGALKQGIRILLILFLGWWLLRDPSGFADSAKAVGGAVWGALVQVFEALRNFANSIGS